jgi:hypothetical protein
MNTFYEHHQVNIKFKYRCFDRILLNGLIQPFQQPERVIGFFNAYREGQRVTRSLLRDIAEQFHNWVKNRAQKWGAPILEEPAGRRDDFVAPYFKRAKMDQVVVILKAREPARIMTAIGEGVRWHLELARRWIVQYNFYLCDRCWGRMFVRVCPYLPFSARVCLNQHNWLANKLRAEGIDFQQHANAFLRCSQPEKLQELADSLSAHDLLTCGQKWLAAFTPFFKESQRQQAGCQHRLFFSQVEYCDNLIFHRRAALDQLDQRLLDANRSLGRPHKITTIFGRKVTKRYRGKLQTVIEDLDLPNPVIRTHYGNGFIKQYVRDRWCLRTETASNDVTDYGIKKAVQNLPQLQQKLSAICDNYLNAQQDILETFIDRGQLRTLTEPTILPSGKRIPGLKLDNPRQLALMHALVRFTHLAAGNTFTTSALHSLTLKARGLSAEEYSLASLRYDLGKLRAKQLVEKLPHSRRYCLTAQGYSICLLFLKLFERIYGPLVAGVLGPYQNDSNLDPPRRTQLDRLYQQVVDDLDKLLGAVGLKKAA